MALEVLQLGFLAFASLVLFYCYFRFQKPLAGFLAATLFLVLGFQLIINGYSVTVFDSQSFNQTNYYQNLSLTEQHWLCPTNKHMNITDLNNVTCVDGTVQEAQFEYHIRNEPYLMNFTQASNTVSVSYSTVRDDFTNFTGLVFVVLGLFLTLISGVELVTKKSRVVS